MFQSLTILGLGLGASETEIKVHYRQLARKYHPDKNNPATTGLNASEASTFFQLLNNAHEYLKDRVQNIFCRTPPFGFKILQSQPKILPTTKILLPQRKEHGFKILQSQRKILPTTKILQPTKLLPTTKILQTTKI
jgi:hypothetical protein